jgi:hypothetical protein
MMDVDADSPVFWLIACALIIAFTSFPIRDIIAASGLVVAALYFLDAYFVWKRKRWGLAAAVILALFTIAGTFALDFESTAGGSTFLFMSQQAYLFVPEYILIFFALRALLR